MRRVAGITLAGLLVVSLTVGLPIALLAWAPADVTKSPPPPTPTLVVDDDGSATVSDCNAIEHATFSTIQAAVNAAPSGATIKVCPGTYHENVEVTKTLTIQGAQVGVDGRTRAVPQSSESVVTGVEFGEGAFELNADGITVDGFSVLNTPGPGIFTYNGHSGYRIQNNIISGNSFGIYANSNGNTQSVIQQNSIHDNNNAGECQGEGYVGISCSTAFGVAIFEDQGSRNVVIQNNRIFFQEVAGVLLFFVPGAGPKLGAFGVTIQNNVMTNIFGNFIALWDATNTTISGNSLSNTQGDRPSSRGPFIVSGNEGIFVGAPSANTQILSNAMTGAFGSGIAIRDVDAFNNLQPGGTTGVVMQSNTVTSSSDNGIDVTVAGPNAAKSTGNTSKNNSEDGVFYGNVTNANSITGTTASGNALDCQDTSHGSGTAGTANTWSSNIGNTSSPAGLCKPPATKTGTG